MYEVFHWGHSECPKKKLPLSIAGSEIIIDQPPPPQLSLAAKAPGSSYYGERFTYTNRYTYTIIGNDFDFVLLLIYFFVNQLMIHIYNISVLSSLLSIFDNRFFWFYFT
jgi:hypothetical protein